ncbi:MAG: hypothetical protein HC846_03115 [Blastocatellia bacterium]|nr:hypothetical protein [Blastocatellia bacterium]
MRKILLFILILTMPTVLFAQNNSCKNKVVNDSEKRDYTKSSTFSFDVDGDGKADNFTHQTYKMKVSGKSKIKENHWITFDLKTSRGKTLKSFFKYKYGTNIADYWIYALVPCKIGQGAKNDLIFIPVTTLRTRR